jgi:hypothetical protein
MTGLVSRFGDVTGFKVCIAKLSGHLLLTPPAIDCAKNEPLISFDPVAARSQGHG